MRVMWRAVPFLAAPKVATPGTRGRKLASPLGVTEFRRLAPARHWHKLTPMKRILLAAVAASMIVIPARDAKADAVAGLRLGITDDPDTFFGGIQFQSLISGGRSVNIYFVPAVDFGVGDDVDFWFVRGAGHFEFHFPLSRDRYASVFPLIGFEVYYYNLDLPEGVDDDGFEPGLDVGGGIMFDRFKFSLYAGLEDVPDITLAFGVLF